MSLPAVSVVVPTFNRANFLRETIQSVLEQTHADFEIIIADDASPDNTAEVVSSFKDSRIHYYRHSSNIGQTANWQFAFNQAQGEFVAPLSDDDLYLPDHLATAIAAIEQYPQAAYYTCPAEYFGHDLGFPYYRPHAFTDTDATQPLVYYPPQLAVAFLGCDNPGPFNSMLCRRTALHSHLYWGPPGYLPQDLLLMTQLMVQGGFIFGAKALTRFRVHKTNISISAQRKSILRFNCMLWYGVRWLARFLLDNRVCTLADIEAHGLQSPLLEAHIVPLILGLGSFDSLPELRAIAQRVFQARPEADKFSARFRLARRLGFQVIPVAEKISQIMVGWRP